MPRHSDDRWAVILAGGDGSRLQPLTQLLFGNQRPKQFCRILGQTTLLAETAERLSRTVGRESTIFVVTRHHEAFYRDDLQRVPVSRVVEQPLNRGTTVAVASALMRIRQLTSADPVVGFFPADHSFTDPAALDRALGSAFSLATALSDRVVLVGARATAPETDFGWIQAGEEIRGRASRSATSGRAHAVRRFLEKPSREVAGRLLEEDWWWNTFISVGRASAFAGLLETSASALWRAFAVVADAPLVRHPDLMRALYATLPPLDFSRDVLAQHPERLAVVGPLDAGWTDLGQPDRVLQTMALRRVPRPKLLRRMAG
jgi:mannose-1-phosphate guanylyltransferase